MLKLVLGFKHLIIKQYLDVISVLLNMLYSFSAMYTLENQNAKGKRKQSYLDPSSSIHDKTKNILHLKGDLFQRRVTLEHTIDLTLYLLSLTI